MLVRFAAFRRDTVWPSLSNQSFTLVKAYGQPGNQSARRMLTRPPMAATRPATTMASPIGCCTSEAGLLKTFGCRGASRFATAAGGFSRTPYSEPLATWVTGRSVDDRSTDSVVAAWASGANVPNAQQIPAITRRERSGRRDMGDIDVRAPDLSANRRARVPGGRRRRSLK